MKKRASYPLNQSPFYKLNSHAKLAKILGLELKTVRNVLKRGTKNYKMSTAAGEGSRALQIPKEQLYRIHKRVNVLLSRITPPEYLFSGVKGRSNCLNARAHQGERAVAKLDISKYYPSTKANAIQKSLRSKFLMSKDVAATLAELCTVDGYVPTGSPASQSISFYANLGHFDHINLYAKSRGLKFTLYVDDLTFSGSQLPKNFVSYVKNYLEKNAGYRCHKIRHYSATSEKVITGIVVQENILRVKNSVRQKIQELHLKTPAFADASNRSESDASIHFQSYIGHLFSAGQINGRYKQRGYAVIQMRRDWGIASLNQHKK